MSKKILFTLLVTLNLYSYSQDCITRSVVVGKKNNKTIDTIRTKIISLIENYNKVFFDETIDFSKYWTGKAIQEYAIPDNLLRLELSTYQLPKYKYQLDIINLFKKDDYWIARIGFNVFNKDSSFLGLLDVYDFGIINQNNSYKFFPLIEKYSFVESSNNSFSLYCENDTKLIKISIDSMECYVKYLNNFFDFSLPKFRCYYFNKNSNINEAIGFIIREADPSQTNERYDASNKIIYVLNYHNFKHELVHSFLVEKFGGNCHNWFNEGCATFLAGSGDYNLNQHLTILANHLIKHPEFNLNNILDYRGFIIDKETSYKYTVSGLICKLVYQKHGKKGLYQLLNFGSSDLDFYISIQSLLGIKKENLNAFLRAEIYKYLI